MEKATININAKQLIKYCSNGTIPSEDILYKLRMINRRAESNIHSVFGYRKFNDDFVDKVTVYSDDNGISTIKFSYDDFLLKLFRYLNINDKPNNMTDEEIEKVLNERLVVLNSSNIKDNLRTEFPLIYSDYHSGLSYLKEVQRMRVNTIEDKRRKEMQEKHYYRCALHPTYYKFVDRQKDLYGRFVNRREDYKEAVKKSSLNNFFKKYFDMDKVAMYITNSYLNICEYLEDEDQIRYYMSLVEKYLKSDYDKSIEIEVENNRVINLDVIQERLSAIRKQYAPVIGLVNWELIPAGKDTTINRGASKYRSRVDLTEEELINLRNKGQKKEDFYNNSNPCAKAYGALKYGCYIAYIYKNGEVLLDTVYDENNPRTAVGNATYNIKARDFQLISGLDKSELKNNPKVVKLNHSKFWEDRVSEIVKRDNGEKSKEEAIQLVKKIKRVDI
ncbi:MAG: hypothetical protein IKE63_05195 [Bacilli bacterium]|nr:hypothetical protein [Bacilli bacterium]